MCLFLFGSFVNTLTLDDIVTAIRGSASFVPTCLILMSHIWAQFVLEAVVYLENGIPDHHWPSILTHSLANLSFHVQCLQYGHLHGSAAEGACTSRIPRTCGRWPTSTTATPTSCITLEDCSSIDFIVVQYVKRGQVTSQRRTFSPRQREPS
jgi:hypothetical protein